MQLPSDDEILATILDAAEAWNMPDWLARMGASLVMAWTRIMESDCQCDGCVTVRGFMAGMRVHVADQD
jgi:hypothetical protein